MGPYFSLCFFQIKVAPLLTPVTSSPIKPVSLSQPQSKATTLSPIRAPAMQDKGKSAVHS